jgi:hypothetical protein
VEIRVLAFKPYSNHPQDDYLRVVFCVRGNEYIVWNENVEISEEGKPCYFQGDYYPRTHEGFTNALKRFNERGYIFEFNK